MAPQAVEKDSPLDVTPQIPPFGAVTSSIEPKEPIFVGKSSLLHRSLIHEPSEVIAAKDSILTLASGQKIIDACGGAAVSCLGHGNEEVSTSHIFIGRCRILD